MIQIPKDVYEAINNPYEGFDKMYYSYLKDGVSNSLAFEKSVDRIRDYFPNYKKYTDYRSYSMCKNRRTRKMLLQNRSK